MPGFIQSIKSRLPQSPFSPPKQSAPVLPSVDVADPADEAPQPEVHPGPEVLPAEALIAPNSSTVALTLTPANGISSQQASDVLEVAESAPNAEETVPESESIFEPEAVAPMVEAASVLPEAEPSATLSTATEAEVSPATPLSDVTEEPANLELAAVEAAPEVIAIEPASVLTPSEPTTTSARPESTQEILTQPETITEIVTQPETITEIVKPAALESKRSISRKEPPVYDPAELAAAVAAPIEDTPIIALPILQVEGVTPDTELVKEAATPEVKEGKLKKKRFMMSPLKKSFSSNNSTDGNSTDESANAKPKKNQPLAGRFKHVLGQVKSKVKKDKDSDKSPSTESATLSDEAGVNDNPASNNIATLPEEDRDIAGSLDTSATSDNAVTA